MAIKGIMDGLPSNFPHLEQPCPFGILTKATKIPRGSTIDVSEFAPGFTLQIHFAFFDVESIHGFTSTFVALCSATLHPFGFTSISKLPLFDILKFLVMILNNQDKKVAFAELMKISH